MMRQWQLMVDKTPRSGAENMAVDEVLLKNVSAGSRLPTLRLYQWSPLCLSLGYGQASTDADPARLQANGWDLVRRPTGGKAILHGDELTYSLTLPVSDDLAQGDVVASYRRIGTALAAALETLGLQPSSEEAAKGNQGLGAICFEVPSHYEITIQQRKLIGSAQVRRKTGVLQHGTIPLTGDITRICDVLSYASEDYREQARQQVLTRAITLSEAVGHTITFEVMADALIHSFVDAFGVEFLDGDLTPQEMEAVAYLAENTYQHPGWTHKR